MKILLVYPHYPDTFWSFRNALKFIGRKASFPPLGLLTGLQLHGDWMAIQPVIPAAWPGFSLHYRHGETIYAIQVENPHGCERGVA